MDERMQFIARVLAGEDEMTVLCREYGGQPQDRLQVARAVHLGRRRGFGGALAPPLQHGQAHELAVVQAVLGLRQRWPDWGPKKLRVKLVELHPELPVPAASTIGEWLRRKGVVGRSRRRRRCDPFTLTDAHSRYLLRCQAVARPDEDNVRPIFEAAFKEHGLPLAIRSDNGPPFASPGVGGLSRLAVWWIKLGIRPERIVAQFASAARAVRRVPRGLQQ
jgi:hypothetical protein